MRFWLAVGVLVAAVVLHAVLPRYRWQVVQGNAAVRFDRWTGSAVVGGYGAGGRWMPRDEFFAEQRQAAAAKATAPAVSKGTHDRSATGDPLEDAVRRADEVLNESPTTASTTRAPVTK